MKKYIPIKEAQKTAPYHNKWYLDRIREGKLEAIGGGKGSKYLIELSSFNKFIASLKTGQSKES